MQKYTVLRKFDGSIIHLFSSKSLDHGTKSNCWAAPTIVLARSIAAGSISSSEMA